MKRKSANKRVLEFSESDQALLTYQQKHLELQVIKRILLTPDLASVLYFKDLKETELQKMVKDLKSRKESCEKEIQEFRKNSKDRLNTLASRRHSTDKKFTNYDYSMWKNIDSSKLQTFQPSTDKQKQGGQRETGGGIQITYGLVAEPDEFIVGQVEGPEEDRDAYEEDTTLMRCTFSMEHSDFFLFSTLYVNIAYMVHKYEIPAPQRKSTLVAWGLFHHCVHLESEPTASLAYLMSQPIYFDSGTDPNVSASRFIDEIRVDETIRISHENGSADTWRECGDGYNALWAIREPGEKTYLYFGTHAWALCKDGAFEASAALELQRSGESFASEVGLPMERGVFYRYVSLDG